MVKDDIVKGMLHPPQCREQIFCVHASNRRWHTSATMAVHLLTAVITVCIPFLDTISMSTLGSLAQV